MRPHVVILGAGATIAAIPNGDKNGKHSSVMNGLIEKLGLQDVLDEIDLSTTSNNLEDIYSELYACSECKEATLELEKRLYDYFASLELPDEPTIYDLLILSMTKKDLIATFNWDPLLIQAYVRCSQITNNLPYVFCLHGNVAMGYCQEHVEYGTLDAKCPVCGKILPPTKLLYPVQEKNYSENDYIQKSWVATRALLEDASTITIFGYSAPKSDEEAVRLLKHAWGGSENRQIEEVSVIDIIAEDEMLDKWSDFIYSHHYRYTNNFYDSYLGMFPRRSCEMIFATLQLNVAPDVTKGFYEGMSWDDVKLLLRPLLLDEMNTPENKNYPLYYVRKEQFER